MKIFITVGARPNIVKAAPLVREAEKRDIEYVLLHTGQHYDYEMSKVFFEDLDIPDPDVHMGQIKKEKQVKIMREIINNERPDFSIVFGDTDSSLYAALASCKVCKIAHVEAGLRSWNMKMKEETNRIIIDQLSDIHFCTERSGMTNIYNEGYYGVLVGNIMIDSLVYMMKKDTKINNRHGDYGVLTIHRSEKSFSEMSKLFKVIENICKSKKIIFPVHPRMKRYEDLYRYINNLYKVDPMGYSDFINLINLSDFVITDSGGVQEETSFLCVPCFTARDETERPVTVSNGTNCIVGNILQDFDSMFDKHIQKLKDRKEFNIPMWDGKTSERIISQLEMSL